MVIIRNAETVVTVVTKIGTNKESIVEATALRVFFFVEAPDAKANPCTSSVARPRCESQLAHP